MKCPSKLLHLIASGVILGGTVSACGGAPDGGRGGLRRSPERADDRGVQGNPGVQDDRGVQGNRGVQDDRGVQGDRDIRSDRDVQSSLGAPSRDPWAAPAPGRSLLMAHAEAATPDDPMKLLAYEMKLRAWRARWWSRLEAQQPEAALAALRAMHQRLDAAIENGESLPAGAFQWDPGLPESVRRDLCFRAGVLSLLAGDAHGGLTWAERGLQIPSTPMNPAIMFLRSNLLLIRAHSHEIRGDSFAATADFAEALTLGRRLFGAGLDQLEPQRPEGGQ